MLDVVSMNITAHCCITALCREHGKSRIRSMTEKQLLASDLFITSLKHPLVVVRIRGLAQGHVMHSNAHEIKR